MKNSPLNTELTERGKKLRLDTIKLAKKNGGYHFGGSFSAIEILIALFDYVLKTDKLNKFVMSKGHACWPYYVLLQEMGYSPLLEGHPHIGNGVNYTTGSMGHGFPATLGMAMARKIAGVGGQLYVLVGDGECQEGTTWESMLIAKKFQVNNLTVIVDMNGIQGSGFVNDILPITALKPTAEAIGWDVIEVDGHNVPELVSAFKINQNINPKLIICNTIKGKGVPFMENIPEWHAKWIDDKTELMIGEILK